MKTIDPSSTIIEESLSQLSIYQRIDACAAICYQRPPKPTEEEAQEFCKSMVKRGHYTTLEMAVVHLMVRSSMDLPLNQKYVQISYRPGHQFLVSGSVRAFMEGCEDDSRIRKFLALEYPVLFPWHGAKRTQGWVRFATPEEIPPDHQHVAAKIITNRAISHELVRHRPCSFLQESQRYVKYDDEVTFIEPEWAREEPMGIGLWQSACQDAENCYMHLRKLGKSPQQARVVLPNSTKTELIIYTSIPQWRHIFNLRCSKAADPEMRRIMIPLRDEMLGRGWEV